MKYTFTLTPDEGDALTLVADTRDLLVWERAFKNRSLTALMKDMRIGDMYEIAHVAARRKRVFDGPLPDFEAAYALDIVDDEPAEDEDDEEVPTNAAP